jgi:hypothetical protein
VPSEATAPDDPHIALPVRSGWEHKTRRGQVMQPSEVSRESLNWKADPYVVGSRVLGQEAIGPVLQLRRGHLLTDLRVKVPHFAVIREVCSPIPQRPEEQAGSGYDDEFTRAHVRLTVRSPMAAPRDSRTAKRPGGAAIR